MSVNWNYFDKFECVNDKYLPSHGEGNSISTQIVTAVNKLIYKWYNDGDVYDNSYYMDGWCNDLSSYANWLYFNTNTKEILMKIKDCFSQGQYENILKELADLLFDENMLEIRNKEETSGSIYDCKGPFRFEEHYEDEEEYF